LLGLRFTGLFNRLNWDTVDAVWITSSFLTVYFLASGMIYDRAMSEGQRAQDNYLTHLVRGRDTSNGNLAEFCVGPSRRVLMITPAELASFCRYNSDAFSAFTQKLVLWNHGRTVSRESDLDQFPTSIVIGPGGSDAVVANVRWDQVRTEFEALNAPVAQLEAAKSTLAWPGFVRSLRIVWLYIFSIVIVLRLMRPLTMRLAAWAKAPSL